MNSKFFDIIIIGGGVAGMTAALNSKRSNKSVLILERNNFGGQISFSPKVENFPTIKSISGMELSEKLFDQVLSLGVEFELEECLEIKKENDIFYIKTDYNSYQSLSVIIATGVVNKKLHLPGEEKLLGKGISYCAICDGAFYEGKNVCVIGDGNSAMQYALMLSNTAPTVYVCTLFDKFFGEKIYEERMKKKDNIKIIQNVSLESYIGESELEKLMFKNTKTNDTFVLDVEGVFIAIGQIPQNQIFSEYVGLDKQGYIITNDTCETKTKGLFAIGDCRQKSVRQLTTAACDGSIASFYAINYLQSCDK